MKYYLTFDIGGTDLKYGIINEQFELIYKNKTASEAKLGGKHILDKIIALSIPLIKSYDAQGISISTAGVVNNQTGLVLAATNAIPNYIGLNIKSYLEAALSLPVSVENDVNCMGLCESVIGAGKDTQSFIALTIGTGIGGSIFVHDALLSGYGYSAGEWGLMTIEGHIFEKVASISALIKTAQQSLNEPIKNGEDVFNLYDEGHVGAQHIISEFYQYLAIGIANLVYALNPEKVVIGGGITTRPSFINELKEALIPRLTPYLAKNFLIEAAHHRNDAGMIGAFVHFKKSLLSVI